MRRAGVFEGGGGRTLALHPPPARNPPFCGSRAGFVESFPQRPVLRDASPEHAGAFSITGEARRRGARVRERSRCRRVPTASFDDEGRKHTPTCCLTPARAVISNILLLINLRWLSARFHGRCNVSCLACLKNVVAIRINFTRHHKHSRISHLIGSNINSNSHFLVLTRPL